VWWRGESIDTPSDVCSSLLSQPDRSIKHPAPGFDTVRGPVAGAQHAIMTYGNDQAYALYCVTYNA
jgi:hypothetical protein